MGKPDDRRGLTAAKASEMLNSTNTGLDEIAYVVECVAGAGARNILAFAYEKAHLIQTGKKPDMSDFPEDENEARLEAFDMARGFARIAV